MQSNNTAFVGHQKIGVPETGRSDAVDDQVDNIPYDQSNDGMSASYYRGERSLPEQEAKLREIAADEARMRTLPEPEPKAYQRPTRHLKKWADK